MLYLRYLRNPPSSASLQGLKPLAAMSCPNSRLSSILFLGLLDTSKIGPIFVTPVAAITGKREASEESQTDATVEGAPRSLRARLHSPEKCEKITLIMQAITRPGPRLKVEFMKKKLY